MQQYIVTFNSTRHMIKCEKLCRDKGIKIKIMPVPTYITAQCGMCILIDEQLQSSVSKLATENGIEIKIQKYEK